MNTLMIQGTASGVGKSMLVAGLCRLLARNGVRVAPFKPQNMSNNAAVTADGGEIGRAQALQALACGLTPTVDMNPVLIKPEADHQAQLIVRGQVVGRLQASRFREDRIALLDTVLASFNTLKSQYDVIIVEGAGSPAEPNLRQGDIANMGFAEVADVPVWLVGDINRGGVFAALTGTLDLLCAAERSRVQALLINGFRGSRGLLGDALEWLERRSSKPIAGVIPWLPLDLPEEDAPFRHQSPSPLRLGDDNGIFHIAVIAYPRLSNHDDIDPLAAEAGITLRFVRTADALQPADLVILPGSKHVVSDLAWLRQQGFVPALERHLRYGGNILGICGGMQMLGQTITDDGVEGGSSTGLEWLSLATTMQAEKTLRRVDQRSRFPANHHITGYEIHHGTSLSDATLFPFAARSSDGQVWGSYLHGLFEQGAFRRAWLAEIGYTHSDGCDQQSRTLASLDLLADALTRELRPDLLQGFSSYCAHGLLP
ncbi:MAG: cobyric acid synthase [Mariprofundales bacterium]|nr:cobyric acid synthase [Mariprofundales bacterium]